MGSDPKPAATILPVACSLLLALLMTNLDNLDTNDDTRLDNMDLLASISAKLTDVLKGRKLAAKLLQEGAQFDSHKAFSVCHRLNRNNDQTKNTNFRRHTPMTMSEHDSIEHFGFLRCTPLADKDEEEHFYSK